MPSKLARLRSQAFVRQQGRCCYCGVSMWIEDPRLFAEAHGITLAQARPLECTAEHLLARQDGGRDSETNIAAACQWCNMRRHRGRKQAPSPEQYQTFVRNRLAQRRWHHPWVLTNPTLADAHLASCGPR